MISNFDQMVRQVMKNPRKKIAVAAAQDEHVLKALSEAKQMGIADAILVGDKYKLNACAKKNGFDLRQFEIIHEEDVKKACRTATALVSSSMADLLMKGLVDTATLLKSVLDKETGLRTGKVLSHVAVFEIPLLDRLVFVTDAAMNIAPDLAAKKDIIENAAGIAHGFGIATPKVAAVCAVEVVNPDMPATIDAACLSKMCDRGQIKGCIVDGPLAVDNALSKEAAEHKGITSPVAGNADVLLVPNIETGNAIYKIITYTTAAKHGGILAGAAAPVILTSRADSHESKLHSIALASLVAGNK